MAISNGRLSFDVAHLGHVELNTDKFEESLDFFTRVYGLTESGRDGNGGRDGDSVYLRAFDDYEFHSLKLTRHHTTGVGHIGYRVASPEALERRVEMIEKAGYGIGCTTAMSVTVPLFDFGIRLVMSSSFIGKRFATRHQAANSQHLKTLRSAITVGGQRLAGWIM